MEEYSRPATLEDLKTLIQSLNDQGADYLLIRPALSATVGRPLGRLVGLKPDPHSCSMRAESIRNRYFIVAPAKAGAHVVDSAGFRPSPE